MALAQRCIVEDSCRPHPITPTPHLSEIEASCHLHLQKKPFQRNRELISKLGPGKSGEQTIIRRLSEVGSERTQHFNLGRI
jgi:hypothetical protein